VVALRSLVAAGCDRLVAGLLDEGFDVVAPVLREGVVVLDHVERPELPAGVREVQGPAAYRVETGATASRFGTSHGPDSAKRFLFPPRETLATMRAGFEIEDEDDDERPLALVGLRACDLHAIEIQDRVFFELDPRYRRRRERAFLVGVDCAEPAETCFCASFGTGPRCTSAFDLAITELDDGFVVQSGSERGARILARLGGRDATPEEAMAPGRIERLAVERMRRRIDDVDEVPALLRRNAANPRWSDVASRCLSCGNCTMVCPTCFCHDVVDGVSLSGDVATRTREWASCFSEDYSWTAGEVVRHSRDARYRQWLTHKFSTWVDQFGTSGCVGCGRCITWCPVGIDVTEEIAAIRVHDGEVELVTT
jgi:ferredoxin